MEWLPVNIYVETMVMHYDKGTHYNIGMILKLGNLLRSGLFGIHVCSFILQDHFDMTNCSQVDEVTISRVHLHT